MSAITPDFPKGSYIDGAEMPEDGYSSVQIEEAVEEMRARKDAAFLEATRRERERCARVCETLSEVARAEMLRQPAGSPARDRYFARREALMGAAVELRLGPPAVAGAPVAPTVALCAAMDMDPCPHDPALRCAGCPGGSMRGEI
ncbi:hypothetical protein ABXN37_19630 [Piscinibacter sakaiensis]|uniref:Phage protein n=1 Tax=Piscinibacter sakaiensis TaxID=1547922 RepID=A0A0K8P3Z5_PISS1|nr:hypothetical protein [Piscinibacter sakaiensis]GAP37337.1 hypothetical protein ISF6_3192 [Piscinibacter sakaiensis]